MKFAASVGKWARGAKQSVLDVRRYVLVNMGGAIIGDTPVLTGMLKGNWQTSVGAPKTSEIPLRPANLAVAELVDVANKLKGDETVFIRNNRPYAVKIEYGHSKKRPEGMLRKNVVMYRRVVMQAIREGKL
jgi:hypothetical protein